MYMYMYLKVNVVSDDLCQKTVIAKIVNLACILCILSRVYMIVYLKVTIFKTDN